MSELYFCRNTSMVCFWYSEFNLQMKEFYSGERILLKKPVYYKTDEQPEVWFTAEQVWEVRGAGNMTTHPWTFFHLKEWKQLPILDTSTTYATLIMEHTYHGQQCVNPPVFPLGRSHLIPCSPCGHWACSPITWYLSEDAKVHPLGSRSEPRGLQHGRWYRHDVQSSDPEDGCQQPGPGVVGCKRADQVRPVASS